MSWALVQSSRSPWRQRWNLTLLPISCRVLRLTVSDSGRPLEGMLQTQLIGKSFRSWWLDAVPVGYVRRVPGRCSGLETGRPI